MGYITISYFTFKFQSLQKTLKDFIKHQRLQTVITMSGKQTKETLLTQTALMIFTFIIYKYCQSSMSTAELSFDTFVSYTKLWNYKREFFLRHLT